MEPKKYITSELFIHDELARRAKLVVDAIPTLWRRDGRIVPSIFIWPSDQVKTEDGSMHDGLIVATLPQDATERGDLIRQSISDTKPYAILIVESTRNSITAVFETHHGTRAWVIPIHEHGDARVLGDVSTTDNKISLGILWRKNSSIN